MIDALFHQSGTTRTETYTPVAEAAASCTTSDTTSYAFGLAIKNGCR